MQQTTAEVFNYTRIHAPILNLGHKKPSEFDSDDVEAGLKKIYSGKIMPDVCLNVTAEEDYKRAVELALLVHVYRDASDRYVILTAEKQKERRLIMDFVGIFSALYKAVEKGDCTSAAADRLVNAQIGMRRTELDEYTVSRMIRKMDCFKEVPTQKGRQFVTMLKITKVVTNIAEAFADQLPKDTSITEQQAWAAKKYYDQLVKEIA